MIPFFSRCLAIASSHGVKISLFLSFPIYSSIENDIRELLSASPSVSYYLSLINAAPFTSHGPTVDGRLKPDLLASGWALQSAKASGGGATCGQEVLSGTSMAAPVAAAAAGIVWQWLQWVYVPEIEDAEASSDDSIAVLGKAMRSSGNMAAELEFESSISDETLVEDSLQTMNSRATTQLNDNLADSKTKTVTDGINVADMGQHTEDTLNINPRQSPMTVANMSVSLLGEITGVMGYRSISSALIKALLIGGSRPIQYRAIESPNEAAPMRKQILNQEGVVSTYNGHRRLALGALYKLTSDGTFKYYYNATSKVSFTLSHQYNSFEHSHCTH